MQNVTLKQLRYFEALARLRHFGRAAESCAISQPALSMQVRDLEAELGAPLVERAPRQVRLTRLGEEMATRAREILRAVDDLGDMARAVRGGLSGRVRLGVIPTIAPYLLPRLIAHLTAAHAGLELELRESVTRKLLRELDSGRLDAAILALPVADRALAQATLVDEEFMLVRPAAEAGRPVPDREGLRAMRLLLLEEGHCFRDQAVAACGGPSALGRDALDGSTLTTLVQMVGAGLGATLVPRMAVAVETRSAPVVVDRLAPPRPTRRIGMVWRRSSPLAPDLATLAETVRAAVVAARDAEPRASPRETVPPPGQPAARAGR